VKDNPTLWLIKSVEQRQRTIHGATSIINFQRDFLDRTTPAARPA
jgi:DNA-directed RNA polymerase specialized sigma54-like protein